MRVISRINALPPRYVAYLRKIGGLLLLVSGSCGGCVFLGLIFPDNRNLAAGFLFPSCCSLLSGLSLHGVYIRGGL